MFDESRPARRGVWTEYGLVEPGGFVAFPTVQHLRQQLFAILKMPVEAAFADAEVTRQQFDAHGFNSLGGKRANAARIQSSGCSGEDLSAVAVAMWCFLYAAERYRTASSASSYGFVTNLRSREPRRKFQGRRRSRRASAHRIPCETR